MKRKMLSILLALCMVCSLLPTMAFAEGTAYDLYVGGVWVTDANKDDLVEAINRAANATVATGEATYDPTNNTLTLDNFSYRGVEEKDLIASTNLTELHIVLKGTNTIESKVRYGIRLQKGGANLTISGYTEDNVPDVLNVSSRKNAIDMDRGSLAVYDATLNVFSTSENALCAVDRLVIRNSTIELKTNNGSYACHKMYQNPIFTDGADNYTVYTGNSYANRSPVTDEYKTNVTTYSGKPYIKIEPLPRHAISLTTLGASDAGLIDYSESAAEGSKVSVKVSAKSGYEVESVTVTKVGGETVAVSGPDENEIYTFTMPTADVNIAVTFKANTPTTYTVTFHANGQGAAPDAIRNLVANTVITAPTAPTAEGYTFGGWYKDVGCTTAFDFTTPITGNITLYAKWTENTPVATPYDLWVGGVRVSDANKDDITAAITAAGGTATGLATYDPDSNTLTLDNFSYTGKGYVEGKALVDGCVAAAIYSNNELKILLEGDSVITHVNSEYNGVSCGIASMINLTIGDSSEDGVGTLTVTSGTNCKVSAALYGYNNVTIAGGIINAKGDVASYTSAGILANYSGITILGGEVTAIGKNSDTYSAGLLALWDIAISNATVNATASEASDESAGIYAYLGEVPISESEVNATAVDAGILASGKITINSSMVEATASAQDGIYTYADIIINSSIVEANGFDSGIYADGDSDITINGGTVKAAASGEYGIGIVAAGTVIVNGGTVEAMSTGEYGYGITTYYGVSCNGDYVVYAGDDASAGKVDVPTNATYANKYVKIAPVLPTDYNLSVGGVQVTSANKDDITAAITAAGGTADGTATYDPDTNTLTLDNFSCSSDVSGGVIDIEDGDITIKLKGNNTLTGTVEDTYGIYTNGNLVICNGEEGVAQGQLTINTVDYCINAHSGTLEITDVKVTATSTGGAGLSANSISLSGATLSAIGGGSIYVIGKSISVENSTVEAYCAYGDSFSSTFKSAPTITGTFTVTAGNDAASAVKVDAPTAETYTTSKYVKIAPATPTPPPATDAPAPTPPTATPTPSVKMDVEDATLNDAAKAVGSAVKSGNADIIPAEGYTKESIAKMQNSGELNLVIEKNAGYDEAEKKLLDDAITAKGGAAGSVMYLEIDALLMSDEGKVVAEVDDTIVPLTITVDLNAEMQKAAKEGKTIYVARAHDGKVAFIEGTLNADKTKLTFDSSKFSTYALVAFDGETITSAQTADAGILLAVSMSVLSVTGSAVLLKKKED